MTDEQIMKGVICCTSHSKGYAGADCNSCPYNDLVSCRRILLKDVESKINSTNSDNNYCIKEEELNGKQ